MALPSQEIKRLLVLDIETAGIAPDFTSLPERFKPLWTKKAQQVEPTLSPEDAYAKRAGIFAEFARVITIGLGIFHQENGAWKLTVQAHTSSDEKELLKEFADILQHQYERHNKDANVTDMVLPTLVAHNGKEFDYPFLCRRFLVHGMDVPHCLYSATRKPWENNLRDTMELWKFGDWKNYTSLDMLAALFDVPSSKTGFDGSQVHGAFHKEKDYHRISEYCAADVVVTSQLYLKMNTTPAVADDKITVKIK